MSLVCASARWNSSLANRTGNPGNPGADRRTCPLANAEWSVRSTAYRQTTTSPFVSTPSHTEGPASSDTGPSPAVLTGFEPAASTLTGWRALQTAPQDLVVFQL